MGNLNCTYLSRFASCSVSNFCEVGILKFSGTNPSREMGMSTSGTDVEIKLHNSD